ncbi:MAG: hypothetical protein IJM30_03755 [Thermoguttaceae bacterium]|nr:hypothetical protein [Thermoguttaceae bacterium]
MRGNSGTYIKCRQLARKLKADPAVVWNRLHSLIKRGLVDYKTLDEIDRKRPDKYYFACETDDWTPPEY